MKMLTVHDRFAPQLTSETFTIELLHTHTHTHNGASITENGDSFISAYEFKPNKFSLLLMNLPWPSEMMTTIII